MKFGTITAQWNNIEVDSDHISATPPEKNGRIEAQKIGYFNYKTTTKKGEEKKGNLHIITPFIKIGAYLL